MTSSPSPPRWSPVGCSRSEGSCERGEQEPGAFPLLDGPPDSVSPLVCLQPHTEGVQPGTSVCPNSTIRESHNHALELKAIVYWNARNGLSCSSLVGIRILICMKYIFWGGHLRTLWRSLRVKILVGKSARWCQITEQVDQPLKPFKVRTCKQKTFLGVYPDISSLPFVLLITIFIVPLLLEKSTPSTGSKPTRRPRFLTQSRAKRDAGTRKTLVLPGVRSLKGTFFFFPPCCLMLHSLT